MDRIGFYQSDYPNLCCNHSLTDISELNYGYCYGVSKDNIPFEAELWYGESPQTKVVSFYLSEIEEIDNIDEEKIIDGRTGNEVFHFNSSAEYNALLSEGMVDNGYIDSLPVLDGYVELLIDWGVISYTSTNRNGTGWRMTDFNGNDLVQISITLEEDGEVLAETPLKFIPFKYNDNNTERHFTVIKGGEADK